MIVNRIYQDSRKIVREVRDEGVLLWTSTHIFDENGEKVKEVREFADGSILTFYLTED